jgi:hypothetical protein
MLSNGLVIDLFDDGDRLVSSVTEIENVTDSVGHI